MSLCADARVVVVPNSNKMEMPFFAVANWEQQRPFCISNLNKMETPYFVQYRNEWSVFDL